MPITRIVDMTVHEEQAIARTGWFKSSYSSSAASCVETFIDTDGIGVRDSKHPRTGAAEPSLALAVPSPQWAGFLRHIQA